MLLRAGLALFLATAAAADPVEVVAVEVTKAADGTWRFDVTLAHPDTGWEHYADGWLVVAPDGTVLGERELLHPHVNEQPFTRSLSGVAIPEGIAEVQVQGRCNIDGVTRPGRTVAVP